MPLTVLSSWPSQLDVTCCEKKGGGWGCGRVNDNHNTTAARERIKFHIGPNVTSHWALETAGWGRAAREEDLNYKLKIKNKKYIWIHYLTNLHFNIQEII